MIRPYWAIRYFAALRVTQIPSYYISHITKPTDYPYIVVTVKNPN